MGYLEIVRAAAQHYEALKRQESLSDSAFDSAFDDARRLGDNLLKLEKDSEGLLIIEQLLNEYLNFIKSMALKNQTQPQLASSRN